MTTTGDLSLREQLFQDLFANAAGVFGRWLRHQPPETQLALSQDLAAGYKTLIVSVQLSPGRFLMIAQAEGEAPEILLELEDDTGAVDPMGY